MTWPPVNPVPDAIAIVGDTDNGCAAGARDGRVSLIATAERWRRTRAAAVSTAADVREAISQLAHSETPSTAHIVTTPDLAEVAPPGSESISRHDAAFALARLYAQGSCLLLCEDGLTGGTDLWDVTATTSTRISNLGTPTKTFGAYCAAAGLETMPTSQVEAMARWGLSPLASSLADLQRTLVDPMISAMQQADVPQGLPLVLVGKLFRNSFFATALAAGTTRATLIPPDPGVGGLCVGLLAAAGRLTEVPSPFSGPAFDVTATKGVLDNCKLSYHYPSDTEARAMVIAALKRGHLVAWFEGGMEWGPRALGHRSILADARNPYVLENLNTFLKKRPPFMSYGLAVRADDANDLFVAARESAHMQFESPLRDEPALAHFVKHAAQPIRFQTVRRDASGFAQILDEFHAQTGAPYLANTSFNAISEPIVASPLDAVRCFFGSGLDMMVLNGLVLTK